MKVQGYIEKLHEFMATRRDVPYAWGSNDCVVFSADGILAVSDNDPLGELRGAWDNEETAQLILEAEGGLIQAVDSRGFVRREINFIQRSDLCLIRDVEGRPSLGIWVGDYAAAPGTEGLMMLPPRTIRLAWEV